MSKLSTRCHCGFFSSSSSPKPCFIPTVNIIVSIHTSNTHCFSLLEFVRHSLFGILNQSYFIWWQKWCENCNIMSKNYWKRSILWIGPLTIIYMRQKWCENIIFVNVKIIQSKVVMVVDRIAFLVWFYFNCFLLSFYEKVQQIVTNHSWFGQENQWNRCKRSISYGNECTSVGKIVRSGIDTNQMGSQQCHEYFGQQFLSPKIAGGHGQK